MEGVRPKDFDKLPAPTSPGCHLTLIPVEELRPRPPSGTKSPLLLLYSKYREEMACVDSKSSQKIKPA
ncbi:MAG: hypothetical protein IPN15_15930 [Saprospiraceae bacterium]|nr:hypothetical protein [Candidatus Vicinibacter affinis]